MLKELFKNKNTIFVKQFILKDRNTLLGFKYLFWLIEYCNFASI